MGGSRSVVVFFRLLAVLPAIIIASMELDIGLITSYTGICGFYIAFVIFTSLVLIFIL
jgi:hypothetical protein